MVAPTNTRICHFYRQKRCRKGANCPFLHDEPASAQLVTTSARPPACMFWQSGTCTKGADCAFTHDPASTSSSNSAHTSRPECMYHLQGKCRHGEACSFAHSTPTLPIKPPTNRHPLLQVPAISKEQPKTTASRCALQHVTSIIQHTQTSNDIQKITELPQRQGVSQNIVQETEESRDAESHRDLVWHAIPGSHVQVRFGDGAVVEDVMTAFDSTRIALSKLPPDASEETIRSLVNSFGRVEDITLFEPDAGNESAPARAIVEFDSCLSALNAATALNELAVTSSLGVTSICAASVLARAGERGVASLRSNSIRLSWYAPSRLAYAHYAAIMHAKAAAKRLDKRTFDNREVAAKFQKPTWNQHTSFTVVLSNIPLSADSLHLSRFAGATDVTLGRPTYDEYRAILMLRQILSTQFGDLESLETQATRPGATKLKALARFSSPTAAEEASAALHNKQQSFLGNGPLWIERIYSIKYTASRAQFLAQRHDLELLQAEDRGDYAVKLRIYDVDANNDPVDPVTIRVYSSEPKALGKLKVVVENLLAGERWTDESGAGVWDACFAGVDGEELLAAANATGNGYARRDVHRRSIHLYGSQEGQAFLRLYLWHELESLRSRRQQLKVDKAMMRRLVTGGFARIQDVFGIENVTFNVAARTLEVRSDDVDQNTIQQILDSSSVPALDLAVAAAECPICFCQVSKPVTLLCGHVYCATCIRDHYMASAARGDTFPVVCLGEDGTCGVPIPRMDLQRLLKPDDEAAMMRSSFLAYIRARPNEFKYCPTPDCPELYRPTAEGTVFQCPSCLSKVCPACHAEFHEGSSCAEYREAKAGLGGDESFRLWKQKNSVQPCPGCGMHLEKISGCNHVVCAACKTHMCWKCMGVFAATDIYGHMKAAHSGIFD
ncbi:hypothetical protein EXIGLDRAFT_639868 [Exidia glandulosa HHB12029]|uniref:RBR-type E3 ubiquitin transferase n=1 Tax=Exidia glandulosa HHB12029 TaxID=1314781 RepID=A0A165MZN3_EXIGL|nr:hypothetical protein EXIGLDRAFT_639868 [Exidia glandulosa HHB12029]